MKKIIFFVFLLFSLSIFGNIPEINVKTEDNKPERSLKIKNIEINVDIANNLAITTAKLTFYNELDRVLEGELYLSLPESGVVSRFALDINGKLRDGVVVEKSKGQEVFESIVRENIDPALLEKTKGNSFKTRVYPIPAKGSRDILIAYEEDLVWSEEGYHYKLPLTLKYKVELFSLKINANGQQIKPFNAQKKDLLNLIFKQNGEIYTTELIEENYIPSKSIHMVLPQKQKETILVEKYKNDRFFYLNSKIETEKMSKKTPQNLCIVWDASNSAKNKNIKSELKLITNYISKLNNPKINLWILRDDLESLGAIEPQKIEEMISSVFFDGGTQLGALNFNLNEFKNCDEIILSTDGVSNIGSNEPIFSDKPIVVINSQPIAEHSVLNYIARKSGGIYLNLDRLTVEDCESKLFESVFQFIKAEYSKEDFEELYPSIPQAISNDFTITGKLKSQKGVLKLHFGFSGEIKTTKEFEITRDGELVDKNMVSRAWAKMRVAELEQQPEKNEKEIVSTGKKYSIVTKFTSLIVLDSLNDYVQHQIVPPIELQEEYFKIVENQKTVEKTKNSQHVEDLLKRYNKMAIYWERKFEWDPPVKKEEAKKKTLRNLNDSVEESYAIASGGSMREQRNGSSNVMSTKVVRASKSDNKPIDFEGKETTGKIQLTKWDPQTPYLKKLKEAEKNHYELYLELKKDYENSSAFYLDVADFFINLKEKKLAIRILSNIAEMQLENHQLLRILAHRLSQLKVYDLALSVFHEVLKIRKEEPQSYRDLGLTYSLDNQPQKAIDYLYEVISKKWDSRFSDIDLIALHEMNGIIALNKNLDLSKIDLRLVKNLDTDIRVVLNWDSDNSDMDLWVTDPNGEKCFYNHKTTFIGGWISRDFTQGYGPEAFWLKRAKPGEYKIEVNYYGSRQQVIAGSTTIQIQLFLNFGRKNQELQEITLRLGEKCEVVKAGTFIIDSKKMGSPVESKESQQDNLDKNPPTKKNDTTEKRKWYHFFD